VVFVEVVATIVVEVVVLKFKVVLVVVSAVEWRSCEMLMINVKANE